MGFVVKICNLSLCHGFQSYGTWYFSSVIFYFVFIPFAFLINIGVIGDEVVWVFFLIVRFIFPLMIFCCCLLCVTNMRVPVHHLRCGVGKDLWNSTLVVTVGYGLYFKPDDDVDKLTKLNMAILTMVLNCSIGQCDIAIVL